jgi:hypothetical protein
MTRSSTTLSDIPGPRLCAYVAALVLPPMCAFSRWQPSPTLVNETLALGLWGLCLTLLPGTPPAGARRHPALMLLVAMGILAVAVVGSWTLGSLPTSLALPPLGLILIACAVAMLGARVAQESSDGARSFAPFAVGMVVAGVLSAIVAVIQVQFGDAAWLPDADLLARSGLPGRAVGNLRQPNHLASLLVWAIIALVPLAQWRLIPRWLGLALGLFMMYGVVLSGSRTGLVGGALVLAVWGVFDAQLSRWTRVVLVASVLVPAWIYVTGWLGLHLGGGQEVGAARRVTEGDSSHFAIWRNTIAMIAQQPLLGVGWGEFNFAWTLTPFPDRPVAFFDHTHDLFLQFAVELGIPLALVVTGLLVTALLQGLRRAWATAGDAGHGARAAWVMVLMIAVHSLDEYPLWYAYFLLPAAWAWGFALGSGPAPRPDGARVLSGIAAGAPSADSGTTLVSLGSEGTGLRWFGAVTMLVAVFATVDYHRVSTIFSDERGLPELKDRISTGETSPFFAHHADYADATTADPPSRALGALERATHALLDTRLMIAWANALAESGQVDRARYVAARLREFHKEDADEFFAPCQDATLLDKPFQCQPEPKGFTWRDFR